MVLYEEIFLCISTLLYMTNFFCIRIGTFSLYVTRSNPIYILIALILHDTSYFMKIFSHISLTQHSNLTSTVPTPGSVSSDHFDPPAETMTTIPTIQNFLTHAEPSSPHLRQSTRPKHAPTYLKDYHRDLTSLTASTSTIVRYPLSSVLLYSRLSPSHRHFVMSISSTTEPSSYAEASCHDCWIKAMQAELHALQLNNTWTLTTLPPHKTTIVV